VPSSAAFSTAQSLNFYGVFRIFVYVNFQLQILKVRVVDAAEVVKYLTVSKDLRNNNQDQELVEIRSPMVYGYTRNVVVQPNKEEGYLQKEAQDDAAILKIPGPINSESGG
jgi:hypothetical protein